MTTGGRVLHDMKAVLPNKRNTLLFVGHQAVGIQGLRLREDKPAMQIHGGVVPVRASIARLDSMLAHADRGEIVWWLAPSHGLPAGGPTDGLGWKAAATGNGERIEI